MGGPWQFAVFIRHFRVTRSLQNSSTADWKAALAKLAIRLQYSLLLRGSGSAICSKELGDTEFDWLFEKALDKPIKIIWSTKHTKITNSFKKLLLKKPTPCG